jgi:hypothetical protein
MERNPYRVPEARVADVVAATDSSRDLPFFPVSAVKLVLMSVATMGIYEIYWFYRNWALYRKRNGSNIRPFWRAIFSVLFCYSLFSEVRKQAQKHGLDANLAAGFLAVVWIVLNVVWRLPDPYWMVSFLAVLALLPVQAAANRVNALVDPDHDRNGGFSAWNFLGLVIGALLLGLVLLGMTVPETQVE